MSKTDNSYDGALISELGVKRYLKATKDIKISNIDFLVRGPEAQKAWQECNFGCHGPTYRVLRRPSTKGEILKPFDDFSPGVAGAVDGMYYQTVGRVDRLAGGVKRTAEGLNVTGKENFRKVGDENIAIYEFATSTFEKILTFEVDVLDNPIAQVVMAVVSEYVTALPEWVIEETHKQAALKLPNKIDTAWLLRAVAIGVVDGANQENLVLAAKLLNDPAQRLVGKQIGKKLAAELAVAISSVITKKIMAQSVELPVLKRRLVRIRKSIGNIKGGLGKAMLSMLNTQGILDISAQSSRQLRQNCPRLWNILRFRLNGANMIYFLVENMVQEYVERLALLEQSPKEFGKIMEALIRARRTPQIFFPGTLG